MDEYLEMLSHSPLFSGMDRAKIASILTCLTATHRSYAKGEYVLTAGEGVHTLGLVLSGAVHVVQEDFWGNLNIIAEITAGGVFAESYACTFGSALSVSVVAQESSVILFLDVRRLLATCSSSCEHHNELIRNLVSMLAAKNLLLNEKVQHVSQRSTREKLLSFLSAESRRHSSATFEITFNRQQLADYLSVDRSAMSGELSKLRAEGVLQYQKNRFQLLESSMASGLGSQPHP